MLIIQDIVDQRNMPRLGDIFECDFIVVSGSGSCGIGLGGFATIWPFASGLFGGF
jgi:hypothetical protein